MDVLRLLRIAICLLAAIPAAAIAAEDLESRVAQIEQLSVTEPWSVSDARIRELTPRLGELTVGQRQRVEFVRLRNLGLAGNHTAALQGLATLLQEEMPPAQRVHMIGTGIHLAANVENWSLAFTWLNTAMTYLP